MNLPIDTVPGTMPPKFRWKQTVTTLVGTQTVDCEGPLPPSVEPAVAQIIALAKHLVKDYEALGKQVEHLQAFKTWVHDYLDNLGVPEAPDGTHGAAGCRIGDRMDWLVAKMAALEKCAAALNDLSIEVPEPAPPMPPKQVSIKNRKG